MDVGDLLKIQNSLTQFQVQLSNWLEKAKLKDLRLSEVDCNPKHEVINGALKIIVPEYPPKINVYNKIEVVDGNILSSVYQDVRNRWYSLIRKAMEGYQGEGITPAIVYMIYYIPWICDVSNFVGKMIIDALMYVGAIGVDDNLEHVPVEIQEARLDKENPRTEIYVVKYENQLEKLLIPWNEVEKYKEEMAKLKAEIEELKLKKQRMREESRVTL